MTRHGRYNEIVLNSSLTCLCEPNSDTTMPRKQYILGGIMMGILATWSLAFAQNSSAMTCSVNAELLRSVGTLQDVNTMMDIRSVDSDQIRSDPFTLATSYFRNAKGPQDFSRALRLFERAAMRGDVEASFILGFMFFEGYGTPRNFCKSGYWYCTAGARGIEEAKYALRAQCDRFGLGAVSR
ncbi:tetratricopeptide repeat protein [Paraburkholderia sp. Clong3]|uniref:tetratricopeptide repeat protein n=1 Tax=Paraburkholderia sp. Clong3 TaxID=2991061 RepID=UPI003D1CBA8B